MYKSITVIAMIILTIFMSYKYLGFKQNQPTKIVQKEVQKENQPTKFLEAHVPSMPYKIITPQIPIILPAPEIVVKVEKTKEFKSAKIRTVKLKKYNIKKNDTIFSIARAHKTSVKEVKFINGLRSDKDLKVGTTLSVPLNTYPPKKKKITKSKSKKNSKLSEQLLAGTKVSNVSFSKSSISKVIKDAKKYLGVKYRYGGTTRKGIDCSAFVRSVFKKNGKNLPRTSTQQASVGKHVNKKNLRKGDLVFFGAYNRNIGHVGLVIDPKKKLMIHASSAGKKVIISSYNKPYYKKHYKGARRI